MTKFKKQFLEEEDFLRIVAEEERLPLADRRIAFTSLPKRVRNAFHPSNTSPHTYTRIGDLLNLRREELLRIPYMGIRSVSEIETYIGKKLPTGKEHRQNFVLSPDKVKTILNLPMEEDRDFMAAWEKMKEAGYQYGPDALENVHLGWVMAMSRYS